MTYLRALLGVLLLTALAGMATAAPASAHTRIDPVSPADGARLAVTPRTLVVGLSEPVAASGLDVRATVDGRPITLGPSTVDGRTLRVGVDGRPGAGSWLVHVTAASWDGDPVEASYAFVVGDGPLVTAEQAVAGPDVDVLAGLRTWLDLLVDLGVLLPAGGLALLLVWRSGLVQHRTRTAIAVGAALAASASLLQAALQGVAVHGGGLAALGSTIDAAWLTPYGLLSLVRAVAVTVLAVLLLRLGGRHRPGLENAAVGCGLVLVLSLAASSHLAGAPLGGLLGMVHVAAVYLWLGGLLILGTSAGPVPDEAWRRWRRVAPWCLALTMLTGAASAMALTTAPAGPGRAAWWGLLVLKVLAVLTTAALALIARSAVVGSAPPALVRRAVLTEATAGVTAIALAVGLASVAV